jgi:hypothetical protein
VVAPLRIANAAPYAAATPIDGAPRTTISRIATATSEVFSRESHTSCEGSNRWSRIRRRRSSR